MMLAPDRVQSALVATVELERATKQQINADEDAAKHRRALAIYRHAHALRIALEDWQDQSK